MYYYQTTPFYRGNQRQPLTRGDIRVVGEGSISVRPDMATINLGVETEDTALENAQTMNAEMIANIKAAIMKMGILEEDIQTINFTIFPIYDFVDGKQSFRGYRVEHMLGLTVSDINKIGALVDLAVKNGANRVSNISFGILDPTILYHEALKLAVADAIAKAKTIAASLQVPLIETPWKVIEEKNRSDGPIPYMESTMVKGVTTEIEPGTQKMTAIVTAFFHTNA